MEQAVLILSLPEDEDHYAVLAYWHPSVDSVTITLYAENGPGAECQATVELPYGAMLNLVANMKSEKLKRNRAR